MTTRPFTSYDFIATGAPTSRTMPARLADIINVKDWGATGVASGNDATAIQAAIDYAISQGGGVVFFPTGNYLCTSPLTVGSSVSTTRVELRGSGKLTTTISYTGANWAISKGVSTYDNIGRIEGLAVYNASTTAATGGIKITGDCISISDCDITGMVCIDASDADGALIKDITLHGTDIGATSGSATPYPTTGVSIYLGDGCTAVDCRITGGTWIAYALSGSGASCMMCSAESVTVAARLGWAPSGEVAAIGCTLQSLQTEKCSIGVELYNCEGCFINGNDITAAEPQAASQAIISTSWAADVATVNVATPHYLTGVTLITLELSGAWQPTTRWVSVTPVGAYGVSTSFTYSLIGSNPGASITGDWKLAILYSLRCRIVSETALIGNAWDANSSLAGVDLDYDGTAQARNNIFMGANGASWKMPTTALHLAGWKFINCGASTMGATTNSLSQNPNPMSQMVYANLPGVFTPPVSGIYPSGPITGQEFDITDGNSAAFDAPQAGGGSGKYKVRYNGSAWKRIG